MDYDEYLNKVCNKINLKSIYNRLTVYYNLRYITSIIFRENVINAAKGKNYFSVIILNCTWICQYVCKQRNGV